MERFFITNTTRFSVFSQTNISTSILPLYISDTLLKILQSGEINFTNTFFPFTKEVD
jgi:hypothetical protein